MGPRLAAASCFFGFGELASMRPQRRAHSDIVFYFCGSCAPMGQLPMAQGRPGAWGSGPELRWGGRRVCLVLVCVVLVDLSPKSLLTAPVKLVSLVSVI